MRRSNALAVLAMVVVMSLVVHAPSAAADPIPVTGAGSTFAAIALDQWRADVNGQGLRVNYTATGSTNGQIGFARGDYDFASSDVSMLPENQPQFQFTYLPIVAGGTALMYNLTDAAGRQIDNLKLSPGTIAKIYTSPDKMFWDDPLILADNPDLAGRLPRKELRRVAREEGSGTTAVFYTYISNTSPAAWTAFQQFQQAYIYQNDSGRFITQFDAGFKAEVARLNGSWTWVKGSDEVAREVATTGRQLDFNGYIGYAEAGYAVQKRLPMAYVKNAAGNWVLPTPRNVAVALLEAQRSNDGTQNLAGVAGSTRPEAYPISSYNYLVVKTSDTSPEGNGKGETIGRYVQYCITEGQRLAAQLGYSPLPPNLVQQGLDVMTKIPGSPAPPPLGNWGRYYEQLEAQKTVKPPQPVTTAAPGGAAAAGGNKGAAAPGAGKGATVAGTSKTNGGSGSSGTGSGSDATDAAAEGTDPTDPSADALGGEMLADGTQSTEVGDGVTDIALTSGRLAPSREELTKIRTTSPIGRLPLGLVMLAFVFVPPAVIGWRSRRSGRRPATG